MSKESDLAHLRSEAGAAYLGGQQFFVGRLKLGASWRGPGMGEVPEWSSALEAVEQAGWVLDRWQVAGDASGGQHAFPVFRRRDAEPTSLQDRPLPPPPRR